MGLFSFVTSLLGAGSQKKAARKARDAQVEAAQLAIDEQRRQFDETQADFAPYQAAGTSALSGIGDFLGLNGNQAQGGAVSGIENSPIFASMMKNGEDGILANGSATGGLRGGDIQGLLAQFRPGLLDSLIQRQLGNLGGIANMGMGAAGSVGQFGANAANQIGDSLTQQGQARAGASLAIGGINAKNWQNAGSQLEDLFKSFLPGGIKL